MVKTYISAVSLQGKNDLLKVIYNPVGFELLNNRKTSFPIIPVIADSYSKGDDVKVIVVRTDNQDTPDNYEILVQELENLGVNKKDIKELIIESSQSKSIGINLLMNLLDEIPDDSLVYADITFGTKPMSAMLLYAMNFIEKIKDSEVEGVYYGEIPRVNGKPIYEEAKIYDLTEFKNLSDLIDVLKGLDVSDIRKSINELFNI
ncbi:MAG: hypothetical protein IJM37_10630 [Lachnospiraceae bacterium]|nr:hypothetical protein [Lachnospiraceae bacterium]